MMFLAVVFALVAAAAAQDQCECSLYIHDTNAIIPGVFVVGPIHEFPDKYNVDDCEAVSWYTCRKFCKDLFIEYEEDPSSQLDQNFPGSADTIGQTFCNQVRERLAEDGWEWEAIDVPAEVEVWGKINPSCDFYGYIMEAVDSWKLCCDAEGQWHRCN